MADEGTCLHNLLDHTYDSWKACITEMPDGLLISGGGCFDGNIKVWNVAENKCVHKLRDFSKERYWNQIHCLRVMPQSNDLFICGSSDDDIKIWNVRLG
jgi:WD40 repeat protein